MFLKDVPTKIQNELLHVCTSATSQNKSAGMYLYGTNKCIIINNNNIIFICLFTWIDIGLLISNFQDVDSVNY